MLFENAYGFKLFFFLNSFFAFPGSNADLPPYREGSALLPGCNIYVFLNFGMPLIL